MVVVEHWLQRVWALRPRRTRALPGGVRVAYEHPAQLAAAAFLRAAAAGDSVDLWARLSAESRGLLEGRFAARSSSPLHGVAALEPGDERIGTVLAPLLAAIAAAAGGLERLGAFGVSAARLVDRRTAYVLLLPDFGEEGFAREDDWRPAHLLAFTHEAREWLVDLGRTASLSAQAGLPDPLGPIA